MHDVTVSVWNRFWSFQLISGLARAGFDVRALGTTRSAPDATSYECCWSSAIATQLGHRFPNQRDQFFSYALSRYEHFAANRTGNTRCFWGWSNHHSKAIQRARNSGVPTILEVGSTHVQHTRRILAAEYKLRGLAPERMLLDELLPKMETEYALADWICVPSSFVARTFSENGVPAEKLHVNPYGTDFAFWAQTPRNSEPRRGKPFVIVYAAQLMLRKGFAYLLDAWRQLAAGNAAELWLIGNVSPDCKNLAARLPYGARLLGGKSHTELRDLYARADAYVLPSLEEGLARSVLEAMAAGLPVIVTEETGATEVMVNGEQGWVVPSRNSTVLAAVFAEAIAAPGVAFARGQAARHCAQLYTWDAYGARAAKFIQTILKAQ